MEIGQNLAGTIIVCCFTIAVVGLMMYAVKKASENDKKSEP